MRSPQGPGDRFGRYELVGLIGRGGMAEAWEGRWVGEAGVSRPVLIKRVLPEFAGDERFLAMFIAEAQISATLSHGNIAQVYDFGRVGNEHFLAMEFVDGVPLHQVLRRARRAGYPVLPLTVSLFIATEMCRGLHYAHTRTNEDGLPLGIVHRDVSPDNVLLSWEGQVKIVDFGIAKAKMLRGFQTQAGVLKGKILYFSPEQAHGTELDARTDVWATGVVLYELLCGKHPFEGSNLQALRRIIAGDFVAPRKLRPELPEQLEQILLRALAVNPEERWASSHELGDALADVLFTAAPRFSGMNVGWLLKTLFKPELDARAEDTRVPPSFLDELSVWKTGTETPATDPHTPDSDGQKTASLRKAKPATPTTAPKTGAPKTAAPTTQAPETAAPKKRSRFLVPAAVAAASVLAIGAVVISLHDSPPPPAPAMLDPLVLAPAAPPPRAREQTPTPTSPLPAANETPRSYQWPVEAILVDSARSRVRIEAGVLPTFESAEAGDFTATELPRVQSAPAIFAVGLGDQQGEEVRPLGASLRFSAVRAIVFFSLGASFEGAGALKRSVTVEGTGLPEAKTVTFVPAAASPDFARAVELRGLNPSAQYQLALLRDDGHPLRGTVVCATGTNGAGGNGDGFVLRPGEPRKITGERAVRCGVLAIGTREPEGDAPVQISEVKVPGNSASDPSNHVNEPGSLGRALLEQADRAVKDRDWEGAKTAAKQCTQSAPTEARCHLLLGKAMDGLGKPDKAEKSFRTFLQLAPQSPEAPAVKKILASYARDRDRNF